MCVVFFIMGDIPTNFLFGSTLWGHVCSEDVFHGSVPFRSCVSVSLGLSSRPNKQVRLIPETCSKEAWTRLIVQMLFVKVF